MTYRLLLYEDQDIVSLKTKFADLGHSTFELEACPPPIDLNSLEDTYDHSDENVDLFLVDYELDTEQVGQGIANYRGTTLATRLREMLPDIPIVLLTRSELPSWTAHKRVVKEGNTFDEILYKDSDLADRPDVTASKLLSLASGFRKLREVTGRTIVDLFDLLHVDEGGHQILMQSLPPGDNWEAVETARWVRGILFGYPGILYDSDFAAVALGVSTETFLQTDIQELLQPAKYQGIFSKEVDRWWKHRLYALAYGQGLERIGDNGLRDKFNQLAREQCGVDVKPAIDEETGLVADTVCFVERIPTRIESSLPYYPDTRPKPMDYARVSFKAIRESNYVDEIFLTEAGRDLLPEIRAPIQ